MKKILTLLLSLLMILSLVGCNSKKEEEPTHIHQYEVDEDGVWICTEDSNILSNTDKPYVAVLENNEPKDIIPLDSITSNKTNLGNGVIYKEDNTIFYNGNNAQTIIIKTEKDNKNNEDKVVINAPNDTVYHYGSSSVISLDAVATNSFHEYGKVDLITLTIARIVLETLSNVKEIYLDINNPNYNYESAIIAIKEEVEIPNLSRDVVDLQEGEIKTLAVIQQLKDETKQDNTVETKTEEESFVKIENIAKSDNDLIIQAFLSPNADTKDKTKLETRQTSTVTLEEAKEGSSHPASKNTFVSKDEKVIEIVKPIDTPKQEETKKQDTEPVVKPTVTPKQEETKKDDPTPTPTPAVTKYTVTFDMQGHGTQVPSQSIEKNKKATKPTDPIVDDYLFGGWYKENTYTNPWNFDVDTVTSNTTLYAKWTQFISIEKPTAVSNLIYNGNEQAGVVEDVGYTVENGKKTNAGNYQATVKLSTGYKWSDGTKSNLIIDWSIAKATYDMSRVTFVEKAVTYNGKEQKIEISGTLPEGVTVLYTNNNGKNVGTYEAIASFKGDSENYEAINNKNAKLTINKASLTATADNKTVTVGDEAPKYTATYTGWVEGESIETVTPTVVAVLACRYTETSAVDEYDITFTTKPEFTNYSVTTVGGKLIVSLDPTYTVTFNLNGIIGTAPETQKVIKDGKVAKPTDPTDTVHTFAGWYKTKDATTGALSDPWDFDNGTVTADMTLYAKWTRTLKSIYTNSDIPKVTNNSAPDNAWENGDGGKAFIAYSTGNTVLYLYKQLQPSGAKQLSCGKDENFTKIGDDYVLDYYLQGKFYGKYTLHMTEGKFTSVTYNGANTAYAELTGTYTAPAAPTEYNVTFDLNGFSGTAPETQKVIKDGKVAKPTDPTDTVHTFAGWYKTKDATTGALSDPWDFDNGTVTADMTLYAKWTRTLGSIYGTNGNVPKSDNNTAPENAWVNDDGGKAFIAYSGKTSEVLYLYKKLEPLGAKQLSCRKTENFTKIGDDYVFDYYLSSSFYGKYTLHMTNGKFTSVTYNGAGTDYEALSGTYAAPAN